MLACFPKGYWYGQEGDYNILILELLGRSLEELFQKCKRKFSLKTVLLLAEQMVAGIEQLHLKGYIHRDIKPENFAMGNGKRRSCVFLMDFGLSKQFRDPFSRLHIPYCERRTFTGTARYASISTHLGAEQSRRDDLEALGYIFVYMLKGELPWQRVQGMEKGDRYERILRIKLKTSVKELCEDLPLEFESYLSYCRRMKFNERPDYVYIKRIFQELFIKQGYTYDNIYDWSQPSFQVLIKPSVDLR